MTSVKTIPILICFVLFLAFCKADWNSTYNDSPIWKVFCDFLYHGRVDSLVNPGNYSGHIHKVFGGNHFSASKKNRTALENYYVTRNSGCTSCSISVADNSNYWTPDLYYQWPNGTFSLVPSSGLTVYYLSRAGFTGKNATNPNWQPFPKGLRMLAGDTLRRSFNASLATNNAISYVCLVANGTASPDQAPGFQTQYSNCGNGMRAQIWFPMCWDGVNLDSSDHKSHMSYPITANANPDFGDCPNSHPVRIPGVFYEHLYSVDQFPHGDGQRQPFVWSNGDPTGYGLHGDFVSGWIPEVMAASIKHPNCSNNNLLMANGNAVNQCPPLAPYLKPSNTKKCTLENLMPTAENLGLSAPISKLPGCNPVVNGPASAVACSASLASSDNAGIFSIKSKALGSYITADKVTRVLYSNFTGNVTLQEYWAFNWNQAQKSGAPANFTTIQNQEDMGFVSPQVTAQLVDGTSTWEFWQPIQYGAYYAFKSDRNQLYMSVAGSGNTISFSATSVTDSELFSLTGSSGGIVALEDGYDSYATIASTDLYNPANQVNIVIILQQQPFSSFQQTNFVSQLATLLCVNSSRIKIVYASSTSSSKKRDDSNTQVTFAITEDPSDPTSTAASIAVTFLQIVTQSPSSLEAIGYTIDPNSVTSATVSVSNTTDTTSTTGTTHSHVGGGVRNAFSAVSLLVLIMLVIVV